MRRDIFGRRPLYWALEGDTIRAAPSAFALHPHSLDPEAVALALRGELTPDRSLFRRIHRVPPGHELRRGETGWQATPYWQPPLWDGEPAPLATPLALWEHLRAAVRSRIRGSSAACMLSGGVDSAAIACVLVAEGLTLRAFTIADDFDDGQEAERARRLASELGAESTFVAVREAELPATFPDAVIACEELLWNGRAAASLLMYRTLRAAGETVVFSGVGADEVLCGNPIALARQAEVARQRAEIAATALARDVAELPPTVPPALGAQPLVALQDRALRSTLPESTLPPECRGAAAAGIDLRLPYLDRDLAEWALRLPPDQRAHDGIGKLLLREMLRGRVPEDIRIQPKQPRLVAPGGQGAARDGWRQLHETWLSPDRLADLPMLKPAAVLALRDRCASGTALAEEDALLLRLTSLSILRQHLKKTGPSPS